MTYCLINGCSYVVGWQLASLPLHTVNIAHYGGSNARTLRTTLDHIVIETLKPALALISLTFAHRYEYWSDQGPVDIWGSGNKAAHPELNQALDVFTNHRDYAQILDDFVNTAILLQHMFRARRIPYVIFNQCNRFQRKDLEAKTLSKLRELDKDRCVLNLTEFVANDYLYRQNIPSKDTELEPTYRHYDTDKFRPLELYLLNYL